MSSQPRIDATETPAPQPAPPQPAPAASHPTGDTIPALTFTPDEKTAHCILEDYSSPNTSLADIAQRAKTSITALCIWLATPDIAEKLEAIESVYTRRARLQLTDSTASIIQVCNHTIQGALKANSTLPYKQDNLKAQELNIRRSNLALTASRLLLSLYKAFTNPPRPRRHYDNTNPTPERAQRASDSGPAPAPDLGPRLPKHLTPLPDLPDLPDIALTPLTINRQCAASSPRSEECAAGSPRSRGGSAATRLPPPAAPAPSDSHASHESYESSRSNGSYSGPSAQPPNPLINPPPTSIHSRIVEQAQASDSPGPHASTTPQPAGFT